MMSTPAHIQRYMDACILLVDTREQEPFELERASIRKALKTGDYSILGPDGRDWSRSDIAIERKSLDDLWGSVFQGRERFENEMRRATRDLMKFAVCVEGDWTDFFKINDPENNRYARSIMATCRDWWIEYDCMFWFAGSRPQAARWTEDVLLKYVRNNLKANPV